MSFKKLFIHQTDLLTLSEQKWVNLKQSIVRCLLSVNSATISELGAELPSSIPTVTKAINELIADKLVVELGKTDSGGGRRASLFSVEPSCAYYLGVEVTRQGVTMGLQNVKNEFVSLDVDEPFVLLNNEESLGELCCLINEFIEETGVDKEAIVGACVNFSGRINSREGFSYNFFYSENRPLSEIIAKQIGLPVFLENDSRAMAFGEYQQGVVEGENNVLFLNYSFGVGVGIITNGQLYYGKSGYSGEFGHSPLFNNEILCQCGKMGCLETEMSGWALSDQFRKAVAQGKKSQIKVGVQSDLQCHLTIIDAVVRLEDTLCIELVTNQAEKMGRYLSILVNMFNPELVVVGGDFAALGDFVLLPVQASLKKYSLGLVSQDMKLKRSSLGKKAGVIGACHIVRQKMLSMSR